MWMDYEWCAKDGMGVFPMHSHPEEKISETVLPLPGPGQYKERKEQMQMDFLLLHMLHEKILLRQELTLLH
jgi:hypothetical protein